MAIKRVWIEPGCIRCGQSKDACPEVFEIPAGGDSAVVLEGVDFGAHEDAIKDAAEGCPVQVIKYEE